MIDSNRERHTRTQRSQPAVLGLFSLAYFLLSFQNCIIHVQSQYCQLGRPETGFVVSLMPMQNSCFEFVSFCMTQEGNGVSVATYVQQKRPPPPWIMPFHTIHIKMVLISCVFPPVFITPLLNKKRENQG
jgi:hypothetical protein